MKFLQSFHNSKDTFKQIRVHGGIISSCNKINTKLKSKTEEANKHSEAERRRRMRINGQYATLRTILPNLIKMDKASVLGETIQKVRELKKAVAEVEAICGLVPDATDGLSLEWCRSEVIKVTLSCQDRVGLMSELMKVLRSVKGVKFRVVKAQMATAGHRTKTVLWLHPAVASGRGRDCKHDDLLLILRRALKVPIFTKL